MLNKKLSLIVPGVLLLLTPPVSAIAGRDAVLRLTVSGVIKPPPEWQDAQNRPVHALDFQFDGFSDPSRPDRERDSKIAIAKLVNAESNHVGVTLSRPQDCWIGVGRINDHDVYFIHNKVPHGSDREIEIKVGDLQEFSVRFKGRGYGSYYGKVTCNRFGSLTYQGS
jgi:hypothetical protein